MVTRPRILIRLAMVLCLAALLPAPAVADPPPVVAAAPSSNSFAIAHVTSVDNKAIDVAFNQTIGTELQNLVVAVPNALLRYVRIGGGSAGQPDALLDGRFLSTAVATAQVVATADKDTLRIVFTGIGNNAVTLQGGAKYELWLDANDNAPTTLSTPWSTTLAAASATGVTAVKVTSVANLAVGQAITIDDETRTITGPTEVHGLFNGTAGDSGTGVDLSAPLDAAHGASAPVAQVGAVAGSTNIKVASVADFAPGQTIIIDSGVDAETAVISTTGAAGNSGPGLTFTAGANGSGLSLVAPLARTHAPGAPVSVSTDLRSLGSLHFASESGAALKEVAPHVTAHYVVKGSAVAPQLAAIASARFLDSRVVRVTFNSTILSGMAFHAYFGNRITLASANPDSSMNPRYVDLVPDTDKKQYDLYFPGDVPARADGYTLTILANPNTTADTATLQTSAGRVPSAATALTATLKRPTATHDQPGIHTVSVNNDRNEITVHLNGKLDRFTLAPAFNPDSCQAKQSTPAPNGSPNTTACLNPYAVRESSNGIAGLVLTKSQLLQVLSFQGLRLDGGGDVVAGLRDEPAFLPSADTIVVTLRDGLHLQPGVGRVTVRPNTVVDKTLAANTSSSSKLLLVLPTRISSKSWNPNGPDYLKRSDGTVSFQEYDYRNSAQTPTAYSDITNAVPDRTTVKTFPSIVVDNKYIKATFAPSFGGRLLSLVYKPTGNDLLYKNPVGTQYQIGVNTFYYHWLQVWGGIMPTFNESEHGKFWNQPWAYTETDTPDAVVINQSITDNINETNSNFRYGATGLTLTVTYTIHKSSPAVDMSVHIHNPNAVAVNYEYWTCNTLAPGVDAKGDNGSPTMQVVAPVQTVTRDNAYTWMEGVAAGTGTPRVLDVSNLSHIYDWMANGIAYGNNLDTGTQKGWWGVVNHENDQGVLRIASSQNGTQTVTPGMKYWMWGYEPSFGTGDTNSFSNPSPLTPGNLGANDVASPSGSNRYVKGDSPAPYIELWNGVSRAFHSPATIPAGGDVNFTDQYIPTMDLANVTNADADGAANVTIESGAATADVWSTHIGQRLTAKLIDLDTGATIASKTFVGSAYDSVRLSGSIAGGHAARLELDDASGNVALTADKAAG